MTTVAAIKLLTFVESVWLAFLAMREDPKGKTNAAFVRYILFVAAACLVEFLMVTSPTAPVFLFWKHFDVFMFLAVPAFFQFSLMLGGHPWASGRRFNVILYGSATFIGLLEGFGMRPLGAVPGRWSFVAQYPQPYWTVHSIVLVAASAMALATVVELYRCHARAKDRRGRVQAAILAGSSLLLAVVGISVELIAAFLPGVVLPLSATATTAYLVVNPFLAFAVVRYGLLQLSPAAAVSAIMHMMSESVILTDQQGAIQFLNPAARGLLGQPPLGVAPPFLGGLLLRRESGDGRPLSYEDLRNGGKGLRDCECLFEVEGRAPLPVSVSSTVLENSRWGESGLIITLRDVSERRKMEVLRDSAERIMRHDLRNTLTGIFTSSSALAREPSLGPAERENAALIHDGARLLNEQIDAYLYLRAVEDGAFKAPLEEVDLIEVLREVLRNQVALAESLNVNVALRIDRGPAGPTDAVRVRGIHAMLFGVFVNLVKNAIEASPFGSEVSVEVARGKPVTVSVRNRGAIPLEIRPRFFTKFATAGKRRGTGLGAYGARIMAEALGCTVTFSTSEEAGTEIVVGFAAGTSSGSA